MSTQLNLSLANKNFEIHFPQGAWLIKYGDKYNLYQLELVRVLFAFRKNGFSGSVQWIEANTLLKKTNIYKNLDILVKDGIIEKKEVFDNRPGFRHFKYCTYTFNPEIVEELNKIKEQPTETPTEPNNDPVEPSEPINQTNTSDTTEKPVEAQEVQESNVIPFNKKQDIPYNEIIDYLNTKADTKFKHGGNKDKLIKARWNEGYTLDDFIHVIDVKTAEWLNTDMEKFITPDTLFGPKFEKYVNQKMPKSKKDDSYRLNNGQGRRYKRREDNEESKSTVRRYKRRVE